MKQIMLIIPAFVVVLTTFSQSKYSIEINPFVRYDRSREFRGDSTSPVFGTAYHRTSGLSYGLNANLKRNLGKRMAVYLGIGYYRHRIDPPQTRNRRGVSDVREIVVLSPLFIPFYTDRYAYNSVALNLGVERTLLRRRKFMLSAAADLNLPYTFSQYYNIKGNPGGTPDQQGKRTDWLGVFANVDVTLLKQFGRFSAGPRLRLPIYSSLRTDSVFPTATGSDFRRRWMGGVSGGIVFTYHFKTNKP